MRPAAGLFVLCAVLAGCAAESPVSPLPTEAPSSVAPPPAAAITSAPVSSAPAASPSATRRPASTSRPVRTRTTPPPAPTTEPTPACQGAVVHTIDVANDELALVPSLCLATGAVLRIENIGPGEVTTDSPDLVEQRYEAGIVQIRLVRAGTVVVTIPQNGTPHDVTVVVR